MRPFAAVAIILMLCSAINFVTVVGDNYNDIANEVSDSCLTRVQTLYLDCVMPLYGRFMGLSSREIRRALVGMSLRELCGLLQTSSRCVDELVTSSCSAEEIAQNPEIRSIGFYSPEAIDYVCVQHYGVFSEGKECLLSEQLGSLIRQHCRGFALTDNCPSERDLTCADQVLTRQCGHDVALRVTELLRDFASSPQSCHPTNTRVKLLSEILHLV